MATKWSNTNDPVASLLMRGQHADKKVTTHHCLWWCGEDDTFAQVCCAYQKRFSKAGYSVTLCKHLSFISSVFHHIRPFGLSFWESFGPLLLTAGHSSRAYLLWSYASCIVWLMDWLWVSNLSIATGTLLTTRKKEEVCVEVPVHLPLSVCVCV